MSANQSSIAASKSTNTSNQSSPVQSQAASSATGDNYGLRRAGGSGSFGAGAASRSNPSPRNNQTSKKKHKSSKRFAAADEDALAEAIAMRSTNSRKGQTSITHLMNFSLPPRPQSNHYGGHSHGRPYRRAPTWGLGSGYHAVDKARYVHANYRFIVDPRADYYPQSTDADIHLDWNNVLQILASAQSQSASCPICLGDPVAPRMARCGHIFCLPCLIRFMHSENEDTKVPEKKARSKKCPLCEDKIYVSETRPVRFYWGQEGEAPREGADVVLRLILRPAASTLALPRDGADILPNDEQVPWHIAAEVMDYARIMKGSEDYMINQFNDEIEEVQSQGRDDELLYGESTEWTRKAVKMINDAKEKIKGIGNPPAMPAKPSDSRLRKSAAPTEASALDAAPSSLEDTEIGSQQKTSSETGVQPAAGPENLDSAVTTESPNAAAGQSQAVSNLSTSLAEFRNRQHEHQPPSEYFFYQAALHYYLSPLDIRILKAAFGDFASFPTTILPRVERVSTGHVVDDELRKRTKYLAHLPYGREVAFLECDWTDTVAPETLEKFKSEIDRRRKRNREKETREEKARIRAEKEEDQKTYAQARRKRPSVSDNRFSADDFQPLVSSEFPGSVDGEHTSTSPPYAPRRQGSAFASLASPSTSPSAPRTVWGTTAIAPATPPLHASSHDQEAPDDGWLQDWEKDLLQEDQMMAQMQAMSMGEGESSKTGAAASSGNGGKKKKKKITLMSTNVRRGA
ncbi:hypothetical protein BKA81DRAFT_292184 [Phyllosticta paracitricarpa]|uniref:RING-type domain-containing protein n=1 Tax=Phyllosticta paracitricarpa TaxID=2016321 RepID=A0ABR1NJX0_9PEZI